MMNFRPDVPALLPNEARISITFTPAEGDKGTEVALDLQLIESPDFNMTNAFAVAIRTTIEKLLTELHDFSKE